MVCDSVQQCRGHFGIPKTLTHSPKSRFVVMIKQPSIKTIHLVTSYGSETNVQEMAGRLEDVKQSLLEFDVQLNITVNEKLHDREIRFDNGWCIKIGRGLDFYQRPESWYGIGVSDISLRKCLETKVDIYKLQD
jgi:ATP-dependent Lon protease